MSKQITVTQPSLPPLEEYLPYLEKIWDSRHVTNNGQFHQQLERSLADYLDVNQVALFNNGTLALLTALLALDLTGEVITTPFSFAATSNCLHWNRLKPVFVDVDPVSLNMDPACIEAAITSETTAIVAVHCYGHPCDVDAIQELADRYKLRVVYDAAHAFGVQDSGGSVLRHGDLSTLSFHATKVFNTFEGGAIICPDIETKERIDSLKNFGIMGTSRVVDHGINGKMSEFNAALGVLQLDYIDGVIEKRRAIDALYRAKLDSVNEIDCIGWSGETVANYSYFPILVRPDYPLSSSGLVSHLQEAGISARRYFSPLISQFPMYRDLPSADMANLPVSTKLSEQILCLPIYPDLEHDKVGEIVELLRAGSIK